jgi:hypothetical protein
MGKTLQRSIDVSRHGDVDGVVVVIPGEGEATIFGAVPGDFENVILGMDIDQVVNVGLSVYLIPKLSTTRENREPKKSAERDHLSDKIYRSDDSTGTTVDREGFYITFTRIRCSPTALW